MLELELEQEPDLPKGRDPVVHPEEPPDILLQGIVTHSPPEGRMQETLAQDRQDDHMSKWKPTGAERLLGN